MTKSMTGYGRAVGSADGFTVTVEIKSVNHRYFEFSAKVYRAYSFLEEKLKTFLNGKLQITISFDTIIDYIILLLYMMRLQSYSKRELNIYISNFRKIKDVLYQSVPKSTFDKIVGANSIQKLEKLENIL